MLKRLLFGFAALAMAGAVFGQAYKWVDEDGIVHYSDRPHEGAERIQLPSSGRSTRSTYTPPTRARTSTSTTEQAEPEEEQPFSYETITISSPAAEETLWNIEGTLNVSVTLQPGLAQGHRVRVFFDGTPQMVDGLNFQIPEVYRGAHNVQVEILDQTGKLMIRSLPNRFYVQQNTIARLN
jgi:hypothetical protein